MPGPVHRPWSRRGRPLRQLVPHRFPDGPPPGGPALTAGELGFERQEGVSEPEDHIAALFDVMGALAAPDEGVDLGVQRGFFAEFLAPWVERFMGDVQGAPSADFYAAVARLGERFAVLEKQYLGLAADDNPLRPGRAMP
ncbi:MAG: molecular chaperone TorD family protein [Arhodomonas sp.]|nr:molecular chaperone TorD family protein [Arhodomonas sp.]